MSHDTIKSLLRQALQSASKSQELAGAEWWEVVGPVRLVLQALDSMATGQLDSRLPGAEAIDEAHGAAVFRCIHKACPLYHRSLIHTYWAVTVYRVQPECRECGQKLDYYTWRLPSLTPEQLATKSNRTGGKGHGRANR